MGTGGRLPLVSLTIATLAAPASAQLATVGAGVLLSNRPAQPVGEVWIASPPLEGWRAYLTTSWTDDAIEPTFISALDYQVLLSTRAVVSAGPGALWLYGPDTYTPYPLLAATGVFPLKAGLNIVTIAGTQPFQDFEWSLVVKVAALVLRAR